MKKYKRGLLICVIIGFLYSVVALYQFCEHNNLNGAFAIGYVYVLVIILPLIYSIYNIPHFIKYLKNRNKPSKE